MKPRYGHIAIRARDLEKTAAFYRDTLGFPEAFRMKDPTGTRLGVIYLYLAPGQFIELFPGGTEEHEKSPAGIGVQHFCIEVDDAAGAQEEIRGRGAPIDTELKTGYSKCIQFWTHDPDGNAIEFMELPPESLQYQANERLARSPGA
ncbi:MAG: VOC family protein [Treponema sp.]|jgi:lactoylglutathione lyase|nr:VOC family protein [Treponema sp.]